MEDSPTLSPSQVGASPQLSPSQVEASPLCRCHMWEQILPIVTEFHRTCNFNQKPPIHFCVEILIISLILRKSPRLIWEG